MDLLAYKQISVQQEVSAWRYSNVAMTCSGCQMLLQKRNTSAEQTELASFSTGYDL
jgi:hypothetical protein